MPTLVADGSKLAELLRLHARGLAQRDVAEGLGVSQRAVCYALKRLRLPPNGYATAASRRKRSRSMTEVARLRNFRAATATIAEPWEAATWPLVGGTVGPRLGYHLFAALARLGAVAHAEPNVQIAPDGLRFLVRAPADRLRALVATVPAGTVVRIAGERVEIGPPEIRDVRPAATLAAWCVTAKGHTEATTLGPWLRSELDRIGLPGRVRPTVGGRRTVKVKGKVIVGFAVRIGGLKARESLIVQTAGLGGRRRFGCGVFLPARQ